MTKGEKIYYLVKQSQMRQHQDLLIGANTLDLSPKARPAKKKLATPSTPKSKFCIEEYKFGTILGEGAYARVIHLRHRKTGKDFALKVISKKLIIKERKKKFVFMEKNILCRLSHPGVVKLHFTFQDKANLYFGMNLVPGGEFIDIIRWKQEQNEKNGVQGACNIKDTQFYMTELLLVLEYLHSQGIIHRDLKPENMLLTADGHVVVNDFGTAKDEKMSAKCTTFCGTACYVSPEVLNSSPASVGADLWAFGCIVYQALTGKLCFQGGNEFLTFELISNHPATRAFEFPEYVPPVARDLIDSLLKQKPEERLGGGASGSDNDYKKLKAHAFFKEYSFDTIRETKAPAMPPIKPLPEPMFDRIEQIDLDPMFSLMGTPTASSSSAGSSPAPSPMHAPRLPPATVHDNSYHEATKGSWQMFLRKDEKVVMSGLVYKKRRLVKQRRMLLLTNSPRLLYIDPETDTLKGTVPWGDEMEVVLKTGNKFNIVTEDRTYVFEDCSDDASRWADAINRQLQLS